jgi:4-diphosphocytidyl-2-C-methyl-D-erythritol kinase
MVQAPAKINLGLDILGPTDEGYHYVRTVMQAIDLCDIIKIKKNNLGEVHLVCLPAVVPQVSDDLSYKAAQLFFREAEIDDYGVDIHVDKVIPAGVGLASGSADAAGVLVGLNELYETKFSVVALCDMALKLGANVPFGIQGGIQLADGVGEIFTALPKLPECFFVIVRPEGSSSMKDAFTLHDQTCIVKRPDIDGLVAGVVTQRLEEVACHLQNVFEVEEAGGMADIGNIKGLLCEQGALGACMTGSGGAVFGFFDNRLKAKRCFRLLNESYSEVFFAVPVDHGAVIIEEGMK